MSNVIGVERFTRRVEPQNYSGYLSTSLVNLAKAARDHIRENGAVPRGYLREDIERSWRRSLRAGVSFDTPLPEMSLPAGFSQELSDQYESLIRSAMPEMDSLTHHFGDHALLMLASPNAEVLQRQGGKDILNSPLGKYLGQGIAWHEDLFGTNALGTVVVENRPLHLNPGEHYLEPLSSYACTAVPITGAAGQLMGVLDITRTERNAQPGDTIGLVSYAVRNIESRLFQSEFHDALILAFHSGRHYLRSSCQGLLALNEAGQILGVNKPGCELLKLNHQQLLGLNIESLFHSDLATLLDDSRRTIGKRQLALGKVYFEWVSRPLPSSSQSSLSRDLAGYGKRSQTAAELASGSATTEPEHYNINAMGGTMKRSFDMAVRALDRQLPVLLMGETGSGKEVAARTLHQHSQRAEQAFVAVNCAAIPENLIESELFGYAEGAFTGARKGGMKGRLLQANGGTLFLDEIGDMPLELQARLLRVLQERKVQPLGGGDEQALDVQLISATHRQLGQQVAEGGFREDLFYRLNGVSITLPALRERKDFARLCEHLIATIGRADVRIEASLLKRMKQYHWPGNIRQLHTVLQVALAFMDDHEAFLTETHLTPDFLSELNTLPRKAGALQDSEASLIRQALDKHDGNVSAAANFLGISRATLYRKLKDSREPKDGRAETGAEA